ncbi:tRNA (guanine-N(7)-)-methyltransferase (tRNA(m7G46)-methyltransferase), partial [Coemansia sp. RSA 2708]
PGARRWNFALRGKPDAPVVGTSTGQALATEVVGSQVSLAGLVASGDRMTMGNAPLEPGDEPPATNDEPPVTSNTTPVTSSMTPVPSAARVGPSEVRRLSASLRSIAVGDDGMRPPSPLAEEPEEEPEEELSEGEDPDAHSGLSQSSSDEAESLVLARVIKTPTPGDLFLDERLMQLSFDLERKTHQMAIVRALMRQAASRQRAHEQRVLRASFRGLRREVHAELEQQRQYELALADHTVSPTRTRVHIPRAVAAAADPGEDHEDADPRPHVVYLIELQQSLPPAAGPAVSEHASSGWMVARRFREFFAMHRELKAAYPHEMRAHELPARTPLLRLQRDRDIEHRRSALERYLQGLLREPQVANSRAVRLFLSSAEPPATRAQAPGAGWMEQIYKTVGEDIEGVTGADSMLEIIVQELGAQVAMQQTAGLLAEDRAELEPSSGLFVDPLSDLFVEVFGLTSRRNWLRRQAISVLLRHIVGGAVERRVRQLIGAALDDSLLGGLLGNLKATLWPPVQGSGARAKFAGFAKRSLEQQRQTRERAQQQMLWYVPRMLGSMVGRRNARDGARVLFDAMQHRAPSLSLALNLFDSCVAAIFPEVKFQLDHI